MRLCHPGGLASGLEVPPGGSGSITDQYYAQQYDQYYRYLHHLHHLEPEPDRIVHREPWIRTNRIQTRILPDLDPDKPDLDPVYPDLDPAQFGARSGLSGAQIITKKMR